MFPLFLLFKLKFNFWAGLRSCQQLNIYFNMLDTSSKAWSFRLLNFENQTNDSKVMHFSFYFQFQVAQIRKALHFWGEMILGF